jgi:hypothetical protein
MAKLTRRFRKRRGASKKRIQRRKRSTMRYFGGDDYTIKQIDDMTEIRELETAVSDIYGKFVRLEDATKPENKADFISKIEALKNKFQKIYCSGKWSCDVENNPFYKTLSGYVTNINVADP